MRVRVFFAELHGLQNTAIFRVQPVDHQIVREHAPECPAIPAQAVSAAQRNRNAVELLEVHINLRQFLKLERRDPERVRYPDETVNTAAPGIG